MHIDLQSLHIIIDITLMKIANLALTQWKMHRFKFCIFSKHVILKIFENFKDACLWLGPPWFN